MLLQRLLVVSQFLNLTMLNFTFYTNIASYGLQGHSDNEDVKI